MKWKFVFVYLCYNDVNSELKSYCNEYIRKFLRM